MKYNISFDYERSLFSYSDLKICIIVRSAFFYCLSDLHPLSPALINLEANILNYKVSNDVKMMFVIVSYVLG